ncbi:unnamed protein product [Prorocentrum cordatum]|uniref:Ion transport domain-containing protein n=1 Tax=Prorocentrum cordatum TaxID=2364126 RepID=A0ABN9V1H7_9DINO|nr:unnamed protein product [Polarella glacialis]
MALRASPQASLPKHRMLAEADVDLPWIKTDQADYLFAGLIVLNAIIIGIDIEVTIRSDDGKPSELLFWLQVLFLVAFMIEMGLRVRADGPAFFRTAAGAFDLAIILSSSAETSVALGGSQAQLPAVGVMRIFRLLRICRIVRILHICPELSLLISGLAASVQAVFWVFLLLVVTMYVAALLTTMQLGQELSNETLRYYFGGVGRSFFSHFMVLTLEGYPALARAAGEPVAKNWYWYLYFVGFIVFSNIIMMNLVTGIVCENVVATAKSDEHATHIYNEESRKFVEVLRALLHSRGIDASSQIMFDQGEHAFLDIMADERVRELLNTFDVCLEIEDYQLFQILDEDGRGHLDSEQFVSSLLRLRGSKETMHSLLVQADIIRGGQRVMGQIKDSSHKIREYSSKVSAALEEHVCTGLRAARQEVEAAMLRQRPPSPPQSTAGRSTPPPLPPPHSPPPHCAGSSAGGHGGRPSALPPPGAPQLRAEEAPDVLRVRAALAAAEAGASQAEAALERLQADLAASRARVRALEARLARRSEGVQTDAEPPALEPAASGNRLPRSPAARGSARLARGARAAPCADAAGAPAGGAARRSPSWFPWDPPLRARSRGAQQRQPSLQGAGAGSPCRSPCGARAAAARAAGAADRQRLLGTFRDSPEGHRLLGTFRDSPEALRGQALAVTSEPD